MTTRPADIARVLRQYPELGVHGFGTETPRKGGDFTEQVRAVRAWIDGHPQEAAALARRGDSYFVKNRAEELSGLKFTHGSFIVGAALAGFTVQRIGTNAVFPARRDH